MHQHSIFNHTLRLKGEKKGTANVTSNSGSQLQLPELKDFTHMSRKKGRDCNLQHYATRMDICLRRCITSLCAGTTSPQVLWAVLGTTVSERHKSVREHPKRRATEMVNSSEEELYEKWLRAAQTRGHRGEPHCSLQLPHEGN